MSSVARMLLILVCAVCVPLSSASAQLDPPLGPPAPTMKPLDAIEPRVCVNELPGDASAVHIISEAGNYYCTDDIGVGQGQVGILVTAPGDVTLDLNGFSVRGVAGASFGVRVVATDGRFHIVDGGVDSCGGGLRIEDKAEVRVERFHVRDCFGQGMCVQYRETDFSLYCEDVHVARCSDGMCVEPSSNYGTGGGGAGGRVVVRASSCVSCSGDGMRCDGPPDPGDGTVPTWTLEVRVNRWECRSIGGNGIVCACDHLICHDSSFTDCGSAGLRVHGNGTERGVDCGGLVVLRCGGAGTGSPEGGIVCVSCRAARTTRARVSSCIGDGMHFSDCDEVLIDDSSISECSSSCVRAKRVAKFKAGAALSKAVNIAGGGGGGGGGTEGGLVCEDCPDVELNGVHVSDCVGDGVSHVHTAAGGLHLSNIVHRDLACRNCTGSGASILLSTASLRCYLYEDRCMYTDNALHGCPMDIPVRCEVHVRSSGTVCTGNGGDGRSISCPVDSPVRCHMDACIYSGNGGNGVSMYATGAGGGAIYLPGRVHVLRCAMDGNGGSGMYCERACFANGSSYCGNSLHGMHCVGPDQTTDMGSMTDCDASNNGADGLRCGPGRFSSGLSRACDNGEAGMRCDNGCLVLHQCDLNANGTNGIEVSGTLNVHGSTSRRNGHAGIRCADGTCRASDTVCELNGTGGGGGAGGAIFIECSSVTLRKCEFSDNTGDGVRCSSTIGPVKWMAPECLASGNSGNGFLLDNCTGEHVRCVATNNGLFGMHFQSACTHMRIADNSCPNNGGGMAVDGLSNIVTGNSASFGPIGGLDIVQGNIGARVVDPTALDQACDPCVNIVY